MRCPRCGLDTAARGYCSGCGARLFAWLGDPFGGMELAAHASAVAMRPAPAGPRTSTAKLLVAVFVIASLTIVSPVWATLLLIAFLVVLRRWPGVGWLPWSLFLGVFVLMAILSQPAAVRILLGGEPRPAPTAVPTRPAAVLTATAISRQATDAYDRGADLWRAGDALAAIDAFSEAIDLRPDWGDAYKYRALAHVSAGQLDVALDDANQAVELDQSTSRIGTLDTRGYVAFKSGHYDAAISDYDAVAAAPGQPPAATLLGRGLAYARTGRLEQARPDLEEGLRLAADLTTVLDPQLADLQFEADTALRTLKTSNSAT